MLIFIRGHDSQPQTEQHANADGFPKRVRDMLNQDYTRFLMVFALFGGSD